MGVAPVLVSVTVRRTVSGATSRSGSTEAVTLSASGKMGSGKGVAAGSGAICKRGPCAGGAQ